MTLVDNQSELNENDDVVPSIVQKNESSKAGVRTWSIYFVFNHTK